MDGVTHFVVIRYYKPGDEEECCDIVKEGMMDTVNNAFISLIEFTFQLIVLTTAVMFIFVGLPFTICLCSIPCVIAFMYACIWQGHKNRTFEITQDMGNIPRVYMSSDSTGFWVAEAFEPHFMTGEPSQYKYPIFTENEFKRKFTDTSCYRRILVGTLGIVRSLTSEDCAWLRRLAVKTKYRRLGIAKALLNESLQFCTDKGYSAVELSTSEWNESARNLYIKKGFQLKHMYHKQLISKIVTVLVYELHYKLQPRKISITP